MLLSKLYFASRDELSIIRDDDDDHYFFIINVFLFLFLLLSFIIIHSKYFPNSDWLKGHV